MCGIAGLIAPRLASPERLEHVRSMIERLRHRGPSGEALWDGGGCALGLARLAIVAPNSPARVLTNETGTLHTVVNGELYNHRELLAGLRERGHRVEDGPDSATIAHLYEERGAEFPEALDGMFAVAIWDQLTGTLTLARDRAGEKPLFIASGPGWFAFASEPGALVTLPWVSRDPSPAALARYLVHGAFAGKDSAFAALRQLPPGHTLVVRDGRDTLTRYWRPWDALRGPNRTKVEVDAAPAAARAALESAVASRVPGEVPFGVFLSGGVDSGLVATLAARAQRRAFPTFSLRLAHRGYDESAYAARVAQSIGSVHHEVAMDAALGTEALESFASGMDQPLGDPSLLPTWALARVAAQHVPVVLTGEGADELFAGYPTYLGHQHARFAQRTPAPVAALAIAIARAVRPRHHHVTIAHMVERFLTVRRLSPFERHVAWFGTARASEALALLSPELRAGVAAEAPLLHATRLAAALLEAGVVTDSKRPGLTAYQLLDFETYLSGDLLAKVDRCTMAHGVESRAPFLRPALIEFALGLPDEAKVRGASGKWALKQAARDLLPPDLLARRKQGFSPPFSAWVRNEMFELVTGALSPDRVRRAGVLDPEAVTRVLDDHLARREDRGRTLWTILSLQMWAENWVMYAPARAQAPITHTHAGSQAAATETSPA